MNRKELIEEYFRWMYNLVCDERYSKGLVYQKLLRHLHEVDFTYTIGMDGNRAEDGVDLRYHFGRAHNYPYAMIADFLDDRPCSVLEMMIALSIRCEKHIMDDPSIGDRTGQWFWNMITSLDLGAMNDHRYNQEYVDQVLDRFLNRRYERNGKGGLFTVKYGKQDLRTMEIWYQMCLYLDTIL